MCPVSGVATHIELTGHIGRVLAFYDVRTYDVPSCVLRCLNMTGQDNQISVCCVYVLKESATKGQATHGRPTERRVTK